jgi:hypothetical protein
MKCTILVLLSFLLTTSLWADVAKVIVLRGEVMAKDSGNNSFRVQKDMWITEGTTIETADKSFVKLLFIDKSQMNLGPESQMVITQFPKQEAGVITLMKGQLRSKVTKDYMDNKKVDESKLFIKTQTAAMGVRGTDFQVNYNQENQNTSLITFSGAVAIAKIENTKEIINSTRALERIVSSDKAVIVREGQYSGVAPELQRVTIPVKIMPSQLESLKKNEDGITQENAKVNSKQFGAPIPPGVDEKSFSGTSKGMKTEIEKSIGRSIASVEKESMSAVPPEGKVDVDTGAIAPTAGGLIDLKTAQYIAPPKGSVFDPVTKTYILPSVMGSFNPQTGQYVNGHYELKSDGSFVPSSESAFDVTPQKGSATPPARISIIPQVSGAVFEGSPSRMKDFLPKENTRSVAQVDPANTKEIKSIVEETKRDNQQIINETLQNNQTSTRSRVRFIIQ